MSRGMRCQGLDIIFDHLCSCHLCITHDKVLLITTLVPRVCLIVRPLVCSGVFPFVCLGASLESNLTIAGCSIPVK